MVFSKMLRNVVLDVTDVMLTWRLLVNRFIHRTLLQDLHHRLVTPIQHQTRY